MKGMADPMPKPEGGLGGAPNPPEPWAPKPEGEGLPKPAEAGLPKPLVGAGPVMGAGFGAGFGDTVQDSDRVVDDAADAEGKAGQDDDIDILSGKILIDKNNQDGDGQGQSNDRSVLQAP